MPCIISPHRPGVDRAKLVKLALANGVSVETIESLLRISPYADRGGDALPTPEFSLEELEQAEEIMKTVPNNR